MKYLACGFLICIVTLLSCSKKDHPSPNNIGNDNGCIEMLFAPVAGNNVSASITDTINRLLLNNHISSNNYRYFRYLHDSLNGADYTTVHAEQYINNLRIFTGRVLYEFKNGQVSFTDGQLTNGTNLNAVPQLRLAQVRKLFIEDAGLFENKADQYKDSCLKAEFGYYNLHTGIANSTELLVKAWRVTFASQTYPLEYPQACYQDNGKRILYSNGFNVFK